MKRASVQSFLVANCQRPRIFRDSTSATTTMAFIIPLDSFVEKWNENESGWKKGGEKKKDPFGRLLNRMSRVNKPRVGWKLHALLVWKREGLQHNEIPLLGNYTPPSAFASPHSLAKQGGLQRIKQYVQIDEKLRWRYYLWAGRDEN